MIRREIRPRQINMRGELVWIVRVPVDLRGSDPATRFFGEDKKAAEAYAKQLRDARVTVGGEFLRLTPIEQGAVIQCLREVGVNGLLEAVAQYRAKVTASSITIEKLKDECIESKRKAGVRDNYLKTLACTLNNFSACHSGRSAKDISAADIEKWMNNGNGWQPKTRLNYLKDVETMFNFATRRGMLTTNPCDGVERPKLEHKPPVIFTVKQVETLLKKCKKTDAPLLGYIIPILFGGLRPKESARIKPPDVRGGIIDLTGGQTKLRERRVVEMNETCKAWMAVPKVVAGNRNLTKRMRRLIKAAKVKWSHDVLRHSFCSYAMQKFGAKDAAKMAGHSEDVLFRHYREIVTSEAAEAFWALRP